MSKWSSDQFPDSYTSSFVPLPHIIRWSGLLDRCILTCTAPWAALQLQRTMNNDCGAYWWCLWTCVSTRTAAYWQSSGLSLHAALARVSVLVGIGSCWLQKHHHFKRPTQECSLLIINIHSLLGHYKCTDPNLKKHWRENVLILIYYNVLLAASPLSLYLCFSKLLQQCASFLLLCTDNKKLHSSADSSSPKAKLIVLKHTAPVKLIIVLAFCCMCCAGPIT